MYKVFLLLTVLFLLVVGMPEIVFGQGTPPMLPDSPEHTPIDGGLGILAAAGGAYALKKIRDRKAV
ncbi:MAG: hypothetical protein U5K69_24305 [Balneolaceae bacterium]|nr:hypothetical protein [Balneolaceae bacterium]